MLWLGNIFRFDFYVHGAIILNLIDNDNGLSRNFFFFFSIVSQFEKVLRTV